ncbi:MAG: response regulator [Desulfatiglans sp.]|nr:response regulator [Thermodesulfobacteriota bacterium]MEE4352277.1 response regulator [Desulfatiglans sp.]
MPNILIVDDQPFIRSLLSEELEDEGYTVESVGDSLLVEGRIKDREPDVVLLDLYLKGFEGWRILREIKGRNPDLPVLILTAYDSYADDPRVSEADGYVLKSFLHFDKLKQKIADVLMH